ncbi:unnamed protein product, partial [Umbelopsis sp. WA50703]
NKINKKIRFPNNNNNNNNNNMNNKTNNKINHLLLKTPQMKRNYLHTTLMMIFLWK